MLHHFWGIDALGQYRALSKLSGRRLLSVDTDVGLTWDEAHRRCPVGVVPAGHNSWDTVTVSGPADAVASFITELQKEGVFVKAVDSSGVAFHSYHISSVAPALKQRLQQVCYSCTCLLYTSPSPRDS